MNDTEMIERINDLIERANPILDTIIIGVNGFGTKHEILNADGQRLFPAWRAQILNLFDSFDDVLSPKNRYLNEADAFLDIPSDRVTKKDVETVIEILRTLQYDIEKGYLSKYSTYVAAGLFSDFVTMSKNLCEDYFLVSAVSLSCAVLEEALRNIANNHKNIDVEEQDTLGSLNQKCYGEKVYNKHYLQQINGWAAIRNDADHGHFEKFDGPHIKGNSGDIIYKKANVLLMINGIEQFLADYQL